MLARFQNGGKGHAAHRQWPLESRLVVECISTHADDVEPWAVLREAKVSCVDNSPRDHVFVAQPTTQGGQHFGKGILVFGSCHAFDIFQLEAHRRLQADIIVNVGEDEATSFLIIDTRGEPCCGPRLTRKP